MIEVIVIGAGQSGLSMSYYLKKAGIAHLVLDAHASIGDNWRLRWDALSLFSPVRYNGMPGMPFPGESWHIPDKNEAAAYLQSYAKHFQLPIRQGVHVQKISPAKQGFEVKTDLEVFNARQVVVATGSFNSPFIPEVSQQVPKSIYQVHSSNFKNATELPEGPALVVGAGASGQQIACITAQNHQVYLSGPKLPNLPRRFLSKDIYWWLYKLKIVTTPRDTWIGKRMFATDAKGGDVTIGESKQKQKVLGIKRLGKLVAWQGKEAVFEKKVQIEGIKSVLWCTGFKNSYGWIEANISDKEGRLRHLRGVIQEVPGLYFLGLQFQYRGNSATMGGTGRDAQFLLEQIKTR